MKSTFNLKEPKSKRPTPIRFIAFFKNENKKLVYSTGELINPEDWDFSNVQPKNLKGRNAKSITQRAIKTQIDRYSSFFIDIVSFYKVSNQDINIDNIKTEFDKNFKRVKPVSNKFFEVYDLFLKMKNEDQTDDANAISTIKRYDYNETLLLEYQSYSQKQLHLNNINNAFYNSFISFCVTEKKHSVNTLSRNLGLLKTFLFWAFNNNHTYKSDFKSFKNVKKEITSEIALNLDQVTAVYEFDFSKNKRLENVRDLFVFGCTTGMRYSNYSIIKKSDIYAGHINVRDKKDPSKSLSIPLNDFSKNILIKYNYKLPIISNQKFNDYIKEVFNKLGYNEITKKTIKIGREIIETEIPLYQRISSHSARRSFITIMKNKKIPDKVIMSYTGHKNLEVFNAYYKPNEDDKVAFMNTVWKLEDKDKSKTIKNNIANH